MRLRRRLLVLLVSGAVVSACGGSGNGADQTTAAPTTTANRAPQATTVPSSAPTPAPASKTMAPTTAAPTTPPPTTLATTSTRQVVTLPPGVTEADRLAAEAAAIGWWDEYYRQLLALPDFDPQAILRRTVPGRPAGPAMVDGLEKRRRNKFSFQPGVVHQTVLLDTRFLAPDLVEIQTCLADDGVFVQEGTGMEELGGLGRVFFLAVLRRSGQGWKVDDFGSFRETEDGRACQ